jgi:excinuclease ABC subunit C
METHQTKEIKSSDIPENAGVYLFKNAAGETIYIGKAKNLKNRVSTYFSTSLAAKTMRMVGEATTVSFIKVNSELEALLLEAKLVREVLPKYNSELKDDKSPLYIGITKDIYPKVISFRKPELPLLKLKTYWGPFVQGGSVRSVLRLLRRVFPYTTHDPGKRPCIYHQIGLCDPCPSEIAREEDKAVKAYKEKQFKKNIKNIKRFLNGEFEGIKKDLLSEMKEYSASENYEQAEHVKRQIATIDHVQAEPLTPAVYVEDPNFLEDIRDRELSELEKIISTYLPVGKLIRIECFDIAHLAGTHPTASMVTFISGEPEKKFYRHFKVKRMKGNSDVDSMKHILERRTLHWKDWGKPDLIIVDGGKPQVSKALEVISDIPLIGLAKQFETLVIKQGDTFVEIRLRNGPAKYLVQRLRDEAHRFARRLHHKHVTKALIPH